MENTKDNILIQTFKELKKIFYHLGLFSFIINILSLALPIYSLQVLDRVLGSSSIETLMYLSIIIFVMLICMNFLNSIREIAFGFIANSFEKKISEKAFISCFNTNLNKTGTQNIKDMNAIKAFITSPNLPTIFDAPWVIIFLAVIFYIHIIPGFLILASAIILAVLAFFNQKLLKKDTEKVNEKTIILSNKTELLAQNAEVVVAMKMEENLSKRYLEEQKELKELEQTLKNKTRKITLGIKTFRFVVQIAITICSAILIIKGKMSAGAYIAISILSSKVLAPFDASVGIFTAITNVKKAYSRLKDGLKNTESFNESKTKLPEAKGGISFENIIYAINNVPIIKNISFKVNSGDIIGIIGKSGSGKTTIARLLTGIFLPNRGKITLNNSDIQNWNSEQLGQYIGYLPQDVELFYGTVKENIARMATEINDEKVVDSAQKTHTHNLISSFAKGYETMVTKTSLSAGQKQQIALARAFYGNVKVVVLDEPNSNLDIEGENSLMQAILCAKQAGITVFIVSHKPSILKVTDKIMVIDSGEMKMFDESRKVIESFSGK